jgi:serine protease AprX
MGVRGMRVWKPAASLLTALGLAGATLPLYAAQTAPTHAPAMHSNVMVDPQVLRAAHRPVPVIVQKLDPADRGPEARIRRLGGTVTRDLPIVNGFAATVPASATARLGELGGIRAVTFDGKMHPAGLIGGAAVKSAYPKEVRAADLWKAGVTGQGVTVALVDTGIANSPDLAGRVLPVRDDLAVQDTPCENLSGDPGCGDSYGHGTFIAGLIAGNGASSNGAWKGIAPNANLVSVKVAGRDGSADVSNVLAAIQWVVSFKDRYNIRVLNLSLGTDSTQTYRTDPLNFAVEKAWDTGVVVVVAASNRGPGPRTISKPGDDPLVITVGAVDDMGTAGLGDDQVPNFSSRGPTAADGLAKPDLAAPGGHLVSLRAPGSAIDTQFPTYVDGSYRKGSGTSMATGVVSGAVALMLQARPAMAPDRVKFALTATARRAASNDRMAVGAGVANAYGALAAPPGLANQGVPRSNGLGSLDLSRGSVRVQAADPAATVVSGTLTLQLLLWNPIVYTTGPWSEVTWYGSNWYGSNWYGSNWYGSNWYGSNWYGSNWYGQPNGSNWYGSNWYGSNWYGAWE